jgi:PAS domain S-box-containing protein
MAALLWTGVVVTPPLFLFLLNRAGDIELKFQSVFVNPGWIHTALDLLIWLVGLLGIIVVMKWRQREDWQLSRVQQELQLTQAAVEQMHDSLFLLGKDGCIRSVNRAAIRNLGYTRQELLQMRVMDINPDADKTLWMKHWERMPQIGSWTFETHHRRKGGEIFPVEVISSRFWYGGREYLLSIARDISQHRKTEALLERRLQYVTRLSAFSRGLLQPSPDAIPCALKHLLEATVASRVYLAQVGDTPDQVVSIASSHEQCAPAVEPRFKEPEFQSGSLQVSSPQRWLRVLRQNQPVLGLVDDLPAEEQACLLERGVLSILIMPIWIDKKWGGYIGLDDVWNKRDWLDGEVDVLRTAAEMLGVYLSHEKAETTLRNSEQRLSEAQRIAHIGSWEWCLHDNSLVWSDETYRIFGVDPDRFVTSYEGFLECVAPDDRERVRAAVDAALWEGAVYSIDHRIQHPDGSMREVHEQGEVIFDGSNNPLGMRGSVQDVTRQKETEQQLQQLLKQNQRLHRRSMRIQEDDRKRLAHELHDEMGQLLSAIKMDVAYIQKKWGHNSTELASVTADIQDIVFQGIQGIREITQRLRPPMLDQFGLLDAIQELVDKWRQRNRDTKISLSMVDEIPRLSDLQEISLYRCVQEGLTNISRHAQADYVTVSLRFEDEWLVLALEDNGRGMDPASTHDGLGLYGLKQRAEAVGGAVCCRSVGGQGFWLSMVLPLAPAKLDGND